MLEILQFYVSGFWVWLGIAVGLVIVVSYSAMAIAAIAEAFRK